MKKTIITLAVLASAATAADQYYYSGLTFASGETTYTGTNTKLEFGISEGNETVTTLDYWAFDFTISLDQSKQYTSTSQGRQDTFVVGNKTGICVALTGLSTDDGVSYASIGLANYGNTPSAAQSLTFTEGDTYRLAYDRQTATVFLYDVTSGTSVQDGYAYDSSKSALTSGSSMAFTNGAREILTVGNVYDLTNATMTSYTTEQKTAANTQFLNAVKSVPEPATATLSLLALAGLAARRRRH